MTQKMKNVMKKYWVLYLMLVPAVVYIFIFNYVPMYGVTIAFKDFQASKGILGSSWVGFEHFERVFSSPDFLTILQNTLILSFYQLAMTFPIPIILALAIHSCASKKIGRIVQNITYAPYFISIVVLVGMMYIMFAPRGVFNVLLTMMGFESRLFMGDPSCFRHMFVWSNVWQTTGWNSIIYIWSLLSAAIIDCPILEVCLADSGQMKIKWSGRQKPLHPKFSCREMRSRKRLIQLMMSFLPQQEVQIVVL